MATRTRPRQLDINRQLPIVRDLSELDSLDGLQDPSAPATAPAAVPETAPSTSVAPLADGTAAPPPAKKKNKPKEIPVPEVKEVPTYTRDYLPTFKIPDIYLHGKGGTNYATTDYVEYDLDNEDEDWLDAFNRAYDSLLPKEVKPGSSAPTAAGTPGHGTQGAGGGSGGDNRLNDVKFERMLWRLELAWAEAADAAAAPADRMNASTLANLSYLPKLQGINVLRKAVGGRDVILDQVYEYWVSKRKRWGKPILRRLMAPTNPNDTNPYNVFRPREKANRPLTRRRRENSAECLEKLRTIRENMLRALQLAELVILRERKKSALHHADITGQRYQLNLVHQPPAVQAGLEAQAVAQLRELQARTCLADARIAQYMAVNNNTARIESLDVQIQRQLLRKRRRLDTELLSSLAVAGSEVLSRAPPPVPPPEPEPLWAYRPNLLALPPLPPPPRGEEPYGPQVSLPEPVQGALAAGTVQAYIGRGGRVALARCNAFSLEPLQPADPTGMTTVAGIPPGGLPAAPELLDAQLYRFHPPQPLPWALALDMSLLPSCVDLAPYVAARQQWAALHEQLGASGLDVPVQSGAPAAAGTSTGARLAPLPWASPSPIPKPPAPPASAVGAGRGGHGIANGGRLGSLQKAGSGLGLGRAISRGLKQQQAGTGMDLGFGHME